MKMILSAAFVKVFLMASEVLARGGGGGSGGGGGGGGGHSFGGASGHSSGLGVSVSPWFFLAAIVAAVPVFMIIRYMAKKQRARQLQRQAELLAKYGLDSKVFRQHVKELFYKFEEAWGSFDIATLKSLLTDEYYKRMVL